MKYIELQEAFEIEINKLTDVINKPSTTIIEHFLNAALDKFWKTRYSQNNFKREGFEQTQKRIDDLRTLIVTKTFTNTEVVKVSSSKYTVTLPQDYVLLLGDTAGIQPADGVINDCWDKDEDGNYITHYSDTIEGTIETVDRIKENSLSEYHLHYTKAKPIKLVEDEEIILYTDGKYKVSEYIMQYLRKPEEIRLTMSNYDEDYTDMPEHTHIEIVKLAAQLYLQNQGDQRYASYTQEVIPSME